MPGTITEGPIVTGDFDLDDFDIDDGDVRMDESLPQDAEVGVGETVLPNEIAGANPPENDRPGYSYSDDDFNFDMPLTQAPTPKGVLFSAYLLRVRKQH